MQVRTLRGCADSRRLGGVIKLKFTRGMANGMGWDGMDKGPGKDARTPWVSRHFPLGKDELFVGTCGKIMGNDGQIWENYGKRWEDME